MVLLLGSTIEILGSHGMQAHQYPEIFRLIEEGKLQPQKLVGEMVNLTSGAEQLKNMNSFTTNGITVISNFQ